ncbi:hypothetical protein [Pseudonocardia sp. ICBG1034]|nr:hypothetical protein [Pseudonocardia sp. ICBG1034]
MGTAYESMMRMDLDRVPAGSACCSSAGCSWARWCSPRACPRAHR